MERNRSWLTRKRRALEAVAAAEMGAAGDLS